MKFLSRYRFLGPLTAVIIALGGLLLTYNWIQASNEVALSNERMSWGFRKNHDHRIPGITQTEQKLIERYNAVFTVNTDQPQVVLTFDMGYEEEGHTPRILEILAEKEVSAAFFVTGHYLSSQPEVSRAILEQGHLLENHSWGHKNLITLSDAGVIDEISKWDDLAFEIASHHGSYFRPPKGEYSERVLKLTQDTGYRTIFWSIALVDWKPMPDPGQAVTKVVNHLHQGAVILLHGTSIDVVNKLPEIIDGIRQAGYEIVPLDEALGDVEPPSADGADDSEGDSGNTEQRTPIQIFIDILRRLFTGK